MCKTENKLTIKRKLELAVISDVHLGTYGCQAKALLTYLNSIAPKILILNGDIIDAWHFKKRYFPKSHLKVIKKIIDMAADGVQVIYITGNHDEAFRKFDGTEMGNISIVNKKVLDLDGKKAWFFHGDVFDVSIKYTKWLAKLGGYGYDLLTVLNRFSLSKKVKNGVKNAIKFIKNYETEIAHLAIENGYEYVVCGHIHQPKMEIIETKNGKTMYLNSGDWIENLTALEYQFKRWKIYHYDEDKLAPFSVNEQDDSIDMQDLIAAITVIKQEVKKPKKEMAD